MTDAAQDAQWKAENNAIQAEIDRLEAFSRQSFDPSFTERTQKHINNLKNLLAVKMANEALIRFQKATEEDHKWVEAIERSKNAAVGMKTRRRFQMQEALNKALKTGLGVVPRVAP